MFQKEDTTFRDMREKSVLQWLDEMSSSQDLVSRHGAKVAKEYMEAMQKEQAELRQQISLRDDFLKRMKNKK